MGKCILGNVLNNVNIVMERATLCKLCLKSQHFSMTSRPSQYLCAPHITDGMWTFSIGDRTAAREMSTGFSNRTSVRCALHNVSGIAVDILLVG